MAHLLAYYKELTQPGGRIVRLEIYRKQTTSASWVVKEIGPVIQALHLDIQGHSGDIDAPIIKTSLVMTFVDAPDHEEASSKKCGSWEEFYTSDSTYWKVLLLAHDEDEQEFRQIWGGYVTPDSFSEQLRYRGSVTIVARDNIGHMQDFPFDAQGNEDGMITLQELVNAAWAKIESPMTLDWRGEEDSAEWLESEGVAAPFTSMNVSAFKEMNWYDAVEKALYSYGIVMRYIGNNRVQMASLRYMPYHGRASIDSVEHIAPIFVAAAERELAPAARRIEETVDYKIGSGKQVPLSVDFSGTSGTCPFLSTNIFGETTTFNIPVWPVSNTGDTGWGNVPSSTLFFNPKKYTIADAEARDNAERMLYLAANTDGSRYVWYGTYLRAKNFSFNLKFGDAIERSTATTVTTAHKVGDEGIGRVRVSSLKCAITVKQQGITKFYNGSDWSVDYAEIDVAVENQAANIDVYMSAYTGEVLVRFFIIDVKLIYSWDHSRGLGYYAPISDFRIEMSGSQPLLETNRINTVYKDDNNVVISRSPDFGPAYNDVIFPEVIRNGIYAHVGDAYLPAKTWEWEFYAGASQHLAVYTHLQLLCYYAKPNNIITGTIINADATRPFAIYTYNGSEHLLISGSVNYLTGMIDGAVIREFTRYSDLWDGATFPPYEENGSTNIEGGSSSGGSSGGGSSGGGGSVTVDTEMSDTSENAVQNKVIKAYVDAVKAELDAIVGGDATDAIESINEILAFLSTMADTDTLAGIVANLKKMIQEGDDGNIRYTDDAIAALKLYLDNADNDLDEKIGNLAEHIDDLESSKAVIFDATSSTDPWELNVLQTSTTIEEMAEAINNGSPIYMRFGSGLVSVANAELYDNGDVSLYVHLVDPEDVISRTIHTYSDGEDWYWESFDNPMGGSANPDEEDITTNEEGNLQFKDRDAINGMGYVILRKNVSLAEQMTKENTIYEVRYTYILEEDLTIPANCILRFVGGVILGSKTIVGNNTAIEASPCQILGEDLVLAGSWRVSESLSEWFGAKPVKGYLNNDLLYADQLGHLDAADDSSKAINQALILSSLSGAVTVLNGGAYRVNRTIVIPSNVTLNLPTSSAIVPYMEGSGIMDEQKVYALAFDKFIPTASMAVAVQMSSYSCRIVGHGTIALAKSRYTIGLHMLGQGWMPMDMAFSSSTDVIISGKTLRGGHYYSADTDTIIGEGEPLANDIAGAEGSTYLDTLTMIKHLWQNGGWTKAQNANHGYNTCFRVEIKGNDFRAINTRFSIWAIHCFRGIEVVTGEGGGWYNSAIWDGTISNMISSFLSIFRGPWIHDFEKINYQIDVNMCKDCKIVYCNIASFCKFGYTWDLAQVPAIAAIPRYYFGAGSSNNLLWLWSKADLYEDNGNNNVIVPKERWVQAFALPKDDAKQVIIGQDYYNALKYRTPWTTFLSNWGKMHNGVIKSSQPLAEADAMAAISSYDYTDITNGTIPAVFFDEDMTTSEEVLNDATQVYAFNLSSQTQMFRMSPCEEMYVELDYAIYDSAGELISGQTQEANIGLLVDAGEDTSVIPLTNNTFKGSGLAYTPRVSKAIITIPEGAVFYYSGIRVGVFFMEQTTGVKVVIYNVKLWKKTYNAGQIMGVERGMTSERPTAAPAGYIYYDTEIGKAIMNVGTSSAMEWKDLAAGGEGGGGGEDNEFITFASPSVAAKCSELYGNNDGKLSYAQAEAVTEIAEGAFRTAAVEGDFLEFVYFKNVTKIGAHGFRTSKLTSIRIPASVTSFGWGAFYQCGSLIKVIIDATTPPTLGGSDFASGNADRKIYVPDSAIDAYKTAWSAYASAIFGQSEL